MFCWTVDLYNDEENLESDFCSFHFMFTHCTADGGFSFSVLENGLRKGHFHGGFQNAVFVPLTFIVKIRLIFLLKAL